MDQQTIIERIAKMLELADETRGGTPAEREVATEKAHKLMLKYNIEESEISGKSAKGDIGEEGHIVEGSTSEWKAKLPIFLGQACYVSGYFQQLARFRWKVVLVGRPENIAFVTQLCKYLIPWLETEATIAFNEAVKFEGADVVKPRSFRRAFFQSATFVIKARLEAERREATGTGMELVRNEDAANQQYLRDQGIKTKERTTREYGSAVGHLLGVQRGQQADITGGGKSLD